MGVFFLYLIKSSLCLILFYLFFKVLLSRETFFHFNRFVLLTGITICTILPLITLQTKEKTIIQQPIMSLKMLMEVNEKNEGNEENEKMEEIVLTTRPQSGRMSIATGSNPWKTKAIGVFYGIGALITLITLSISIIKMIRLIRKGRKIQESPYSIVLTGQKICPFSFGSYIVLSETDYYQNSNEILTHERIHAQKKHSIDLLFMEVLILIHWFNPVVWLLKRELQDVHEYEADNGVLQQGIDATQYQLLLVKKAVGARSYAIANSFNHSKIKNRITMMLKRKSTKRARFRLLLFVPLAAVVLQAFALPEMIRLEESLNNSEGTTILQDGKWTKDYFDKKVDGQTKVIDCNYLNEILIALSGDSMIVVASTWHQNKKVTIAQKGLYSMEKGSTVIKESLQKYENSKIMQGTFSPTVITIEYKESSGKLQQLLNMIGEFDDQARQKRGTKEKLRVDESAEPVLVVFNNQKIEKFKSSVFKPVPQAKKNTSPGLKETVKFTPPAIMKEQGGNIQDDIVSVPVLKETVKYTPPKVKKDEKKTKEIVIVKDEPVVVVTKDTLPPPPPPILKRRSEE